MGVQMFVCPSVGMWRANGNPNLDEIIPTCPRKDLVQVSPPPPQPLGLGDLKP